MRAQPEPTSEQVRVTDCAVKYTPLATLAAVMGSSQSVTVVKLKVAG
jgi:hypothetical protein